MGTPLRVGFLIDRWDPRRGGAEQALDLLARRLIADGHDVHAFGLGAGAGAVGTFHPVAVSGATRARRERNLGPALVAAAEAAGCERTVGIRHLPRVDLYWPHGGSHRRSLEVRRGGPAAPRWGRHRVFLDFEGELLDRGGAARIACVSRAVRDELAELHPACAGRLVVVPNGVDLERFHPRGRAAARDRLRTDLGLGVEVPLLVFCARDPRLKGLAELYAALARLGEHPWHLLVAGPRHASRWARVARRAGLAADRVTVRDEVDAPTLFAGADLLVHPTWRDTSGLVLLESLASGTPVLTSARAGAAEVLAGRDGAGEVVGDPDDTEAWSGALARWARPRGAETGFDPAAVRAAVLDRGLGPWLDALAALVRG